MDKSSDGSCSTAKSSEELSCKDDTICSGENVEASTSASDSVDVVMTIAGTGRRSSGDGAESESLDVFSDRNFLVGPGGSALLSKDELLAVLPDKKVRIFIGSWNINSKVRHGSKSDGRVQDYRKIVQSLKFKDYPPKHGSSDIASAYDNVFWLGDLNFKVEDERTTVEALLSRVPVLSVKDFEAVLRKDQLRKEIKSGKIFHRFQEAEIRFHPTYKYDVGSNNFDSSSKNRVPSYTDRILYRRNASKIEGGHIESIVYSSAHSVDFSDHKPVYAVLKVPIKPGSNREKNNSVQCDLMEAFQSDELLRTGFTVYCSTSISVQSKLAIQKCNVKTTKHEIIC